MEIGSLIETEVNIGRIKQSNDSGIPWIQRLLKGNPQDSRQLYHKIRKLLRDIDTWSSDIKVKIGALLLKTMMNSVTDKDGEKIFSMGYSIVSGTLRKVGIITMSPAVYGSIYNITPSFLHPRYLPMIVPPKSWDNRKYYGAYLQLKSPLLKNTTKAQIEAVKRCNMKKVLEGLDYLGSVAWNINEPVLETINEAVTRGLIIGEIPANNDLDVPTIEEYFDSSSSSSNPKTKDDLREYYRWKARIEKRNSEMHSLRCDMKIKLSIARQFLKENIYFPHNMDFRGRAYPIPPNLNHLGSDLCRGLLLFAEKKPLGKDGLRWLKIHLANLWGNNKISFDERIQWAESNMEMIIDSAKHPLNGKLWWTNAESPFQALATCKEIHSALQLENPSEYLCGLPVHQDGSCNGLQHYAGLGLDKAGAIAVNLIDGSCPADVYSRVLDKVRSRVNSDSLISEDSSDPKDAQKSRIARLVKPIVSRKVIKQTVMTSVYGVTPIGAREQSKMFYCWNFQI
jgi:DNA-directed RNA polymerase